MMQYAATMELDSRRGFIDRRDGNRHISVFRVGRLVYGGHDQLCVVRNISSSGAMIEASRLPPIDARVEIELRSDRAVKAVVRWAGEREAGIAFDEPINVAVMLRETRSSILRTQPRAPRFVRHRRARIVTNDRTSSGLITNISINGIAIGTTDRFSRDEPVIITIEGLGAVRAYTRWSGGGETGFALQTPLSYRALADWLDKPACADEGFEPTSRAAAAR